jgi:hypothetical protein
VIALYAASVTLSASLLFLVQPLIAKIILPWFGGTSAVWTAVLVFFQLCVLGGYAYAHALTRLPRERVQRLVHCTLLIASCAFMPILPAEAWRPMDAADPTGRILVLLAATVGLPAFLLSATSPLLQVWFLRRARETPYWLFALSNFGSLLALLSFPILFEPWFDANTLAWGWSALFVVFVMLCVVVAWKSAAQPETSEPVIAEPARAPGIVQMLAWVGFAAAASALLVSVSAHLSTNVAPIPLLWVLPLALYLLTFILCFGNTSLYNRRTFFPVLAAALGCLGYLYAQGDRNWHIGYLIPVLLAALFAVCLACHGEVVHRRPAAPYLTRFYLLIALGGALGGSAVALLAPRVFDTYLELPLLLIAIAVANVGMQWRRRGSSVTLWPVRIAMAAGVVALASYFLQAELNVREENLHVSRNFYGVLRVRDEQVGETPARRNLIHGTISHGYQFLDEPYRLVASAYFSTQSGVGRVLEALADRGPIRYGVIGLGAGILASYARAGDYVRLYEINPAVATIAEERFTFLSQARRDGADVGVLLGDARLTLERQSRQDFDVLAVDAFSSDAIPTHLLTREAMDVYFRHLKPDGVLAVHISNRYLDLAPVVLRAAEHVARDAIVVRQPSDGMSYTSVWVLITSSRELLNHPQFLGADMRPAIADASFPGWTDRYGSLWPILKLRESRSAG